MVDMRGSAVALGALSAPRGGHWHLLLPAVTSHANSRPPSAACNLSSLGLLLLLPLLLQ